MNPKEEPKVLHTIVEFNEDDEPPSRHLAGTNLGGEFELLTSCTPSRVNNERIRISEKSLSFMQQHFPNATEKDWNSWNWQIRNSYTSFTQLKNLLRLSDNEIQPFESKNGSLPIRITPYYASLMSIYNDKDSLRKTMVPTVDELIRSKGESSDPLSEEHHSPVPNLVHRYPDRVLFLVTGFCSAYCRYCTRSHMVAKDKCHVGIKAWIPAIEYIKNHPEVRDVLISGGDPLTMPDAHIEYLLKSLRAIPHVEFIRIGTKVPVVLPMRITKSLVSILKKYHPLFMSLHFTHPDEITQEVKEACERLANAGIPLGSQTVLLRGINDTTEIMKKLMHKLLTIRVRPYYLYQCDPIPGSMHFRTSVDKGLEIIRGLRGFTSGYAVPTYVIDAPGGGGKIPLLPDYYQGKECGEVILKNFENRTFKYPDYIE